MDFNKHVNQAASKAYKNESKLSDDVLNMVGMSGNMGRHFLNNLIYDGCNYLEVGTHVGSTLCSALYQNTPNKTFSIDNFAQFGLHDELSPQLYGNIEKFLPQINGHVHIDHDCYDIDFAKYNIKNIDIYMFDGPHSEKNHYDAIIDYFPVLSNTSIILIDDWNGIEARNGTHNALKQLYKDKKIESPDTITLPEYLSDKIEEFPQGGHAELNYGEDRLGWHNGFGVFIVKKIVE